MINELLSMLLTLIILIIPFIFGLGYDNEVIRAIFLGLFIVESLIVSEFISNELERRNHNE